MQSVKSSLEDADLALLLADVRELVEENHAIFQSLRLKVPALVVLNKSDQVKDIESIRERERFYASQSYCKEVLVISALKSRVLIFVGTDQIAPSEGRTILPGG